MNCNDKMSLRQSVTKRPAPKAPSPKPEKQENEEVTKLVVDECKGSNARENTIAENTDGTNESKHDEHNDSVELNTEELSCILTAPTKDLPPEPIIEANVFRERLYKHKKPLSPPPPISFKQCHPPPPKSVLVTATRHSSMKSEMSPNRSPAKKGVQFNPETTMVTLPDSMDLHVTNHHNPIKYNRCLKDGPSCNQLPKVVESSFTGQPIQVGSAQSPALNESTSGSTARSHQAPVRSHQPQHRNSQHISADQNNHLLLSPVVTYAQNPLKVKY